MDTESTPAAARTPAPATHSVRSRAGHRRAGHPSLLAGPRPCRRFASPTAARR